MQKYQSHKIVEAAKVMDMERHAGGQSGDVTSLLLDNGEFQRVDDDWLRKHAPSTGSLVNMIGGYLVRYGPDGYLSWSPAEAFEQGYAPFTDGQIKGLPVKGYRPQDEGKVALVNGFKVDEELLLRKLDALRDGNLPFSTAPGSVNYAMADQRWLAIGRTALEQAFMAINRAVFQPLRVTLPEDDMPHNGRDTEINRS